MSQASGSSPAVNSRKRQRPADDEGSRSRTLTPGGAAELAEDMVGDIYVGTGTDEKLWRVHIKRFGDVSPWLKRAFVEAIAAQPDARYPAVRLPDDSPRVFEWVHNYIYAVSFSGLKMAPVPVINDAGSHGLKTPKETPAPPPPVVESDSEDEVVITGVRVKIENEAEPLADPAPAPAPGPDQKPPVAGSETATNQGNGDDEDMKEVPADSVTPRDVMDLYLLALKLEMYSLRNASIDALHVWFHPDHQLKANRRRDRTATANPDGADNAAVGVEEYEPTKQLPFRRVPWLTDVRHVFAHTKEDNPLRRFLICTLAIFLFSKRPEGKNLPEEWKGVLAEGEGGGEIGYHLLKFMAGVKWVGGMNEKGDKVKLRVWPRYAFHEARENISVE